MQIVIQHPGTEARLLRAWIDRRVRAATLRLRQMVAHVSVRLSDVNGPRGGVDKRCRLMLRTEGGQTVVVDAQADRWRPAVENALARALHAAARLAQRSRTQRRTGLPRQPPPLQADETPAGVPIRSAATVPFHPL